MENNKMRIGVIGAGAISDVYLKNMIEVYDNLDVAGVAAKHIVNAEKKAQQYGITAYTVESMLADDSIEMVVVLTPVASHYDLIKQALKAGKHVYTEKTITDDVERAKELLQIADEKGLYLGAAPDTFMGSALQTARYVIDSGLLGEVHSFSASVPRSNHILLSLFPFLREPGAGIVHDFGVYFVTALVSLFGPVKRVAGVIGRPYPTHKNVYVLSPDFGKVMDTPVESQVSAILMMANGVTGTLHIDADSNFHEKTDFAVYGTRGILYLNNAQNFGGELKFLPNAANPYQEEPPVTLWNYTNLNDNARGIGPSEMARAILEGRPNRASKEMAVHVLEVLTAIYNGGEDGDFRDICSTCERPEPIPVKDIGAKNIGHVAINMRDPVAMVDFYKNVLGMKEIFSLTYADLLVSFKEDVAKKGDSAYVVKKTDAEKGDGSAYSADELIAMIEANKDEKWLTYFQMADRQFIELFYPNPTVTRTIDNREGNYGFFKMNFEVESIEAIREQLEKHGVRFVEDIHTTIDRAREIVVLDPDGNTIQFTEYPKDSNAMICMPPVPEEHSISHVQYTTQVAYNVQDWVNMENFYCLGLGFKKVATLYYRDLAPFMAAAGQLDDQTNLLLQTILDRPWLDYIEVAPHQYIELFHTDARILNEDRSLIDAFGYQHLCIEVEDIQAAWDAVTGNGLVPETEIRLGQDGAYQFWMVDPDGNRLELMEYIDGSKALNGTARIESE